MRTIYSLYIIFLVNNFHVKNFRRFAQNENFLTTKNSRITAMFDYFFLNEACTSKGKHMVDLKTFCGLSLNIPNVQPANVIYLSVVDMHANTIEAMEAVVSK